MTDWISARPRIQTGVCCGDGDGRLCQRSLWVVFEAKVKLLRTVRDGGKENNLEEKKRQGCRSVKAQATTRHNAGAARGQSSWGAKLDLDAKPIRGHAPKSGSPF